MKMNPFIALMPHDINRAHVIRLAHLYFQRVKQFFQNRLGSGKIFNLPPQREGLMKPVRRILHRQP